MNYLSLKQQLAKELRKNELLRNVAAKNTADIDYIAMMCDVELDFPEDDLFDEELEEV